ncbi:MAG: hypothetical protein Cons2KO_01500 [Congregibacter sp.]
MLKILIIVFMILLIVSLGSSLFFLMIDQGDKNKRRTMHSLGVRLGLAVGLMGLVVYGVASGQLGHQNPWDAGPRGDQSTEVLDGQ